MRRAFVEGRQILTRDRQLLTEWRIEAFLIVGERPLDQLREVVLAFDLQPPARLFTRCRVCNGVPAAVSGPVVAARLPERVRLREERFTQCPDCGRLYWEGSHTRRMRATLRSVFRND